MKNNNLYNNTSNNTHIINIPNHSRNNPIQTQYSIPDDPLQSINFQLLSQLLPRQTPRWCYLTFTLWSLIALDTPRNPDVVGLIQFLEVIQWRANGKVTEDEFSVLYSEWMKADSSSKPSGGGGGGTTVPINQLHPTQRKKTIILTISIFRCILLEKNHSETDLDLFIGILIHENNLRLLNTTISYVNKLYQQQQQQQQVMKTVPAFNLEVVTRKWLELAEELFFVLDTPGYGALRFDEVFFFCCSVSIGFQGWNNEIELETDLSLTSMTAVTLQFIRDCGVTNINVQLNRSNYFAGTDYDDPLLPPSSTSALRGNRSNQTINNVNMIRESMKQEITLPMFKRYLIQKNVGEFELMILLQHIKLCIEKIARLARVSGAEDLYQACQPYEHKGSVIGSPKLFQEAVLFASGFQPPSANAASGVGAGGGGGGSSSNSPLPSILLFLLSDADKYLSGSFRAIEFDVEGVGFSGEEKYLQNAFGGGNNITKDLTNPLITRTAANEELHDNAKRLYAIFRVWTQEPPFLQSGGGRGVERGGGFGPQDSFFPSNPNDLFRDPTYQLIISTLLHYKRLQHILNAGFYDFSLNQFGNNPVAANTQANSLSVLCAGLLPTAQLLLVEFGLCSEETIQADLPVEDGVQQQPETNLPMSIDELSNLPRRQSVYANTEQLRRQSTFVRDDKDPIGKTDLGKPETGKSNNKPKDPPNYIKPTRTFIAKTIKEKKIESESADSTAAEQPRAAIAYNSSDTDISKAKWQSLLDVRTTPPLPTPPTISPRNAPTEDSSKRGVNLSSSAPDSRGRTINLSEKERKSQGISPSALVLNEDESKLLAQLLVTNNVHEQHAIIDRLRSKVASLPITDSHDLEDSRPNLNVLSPLSASPKSSPDRYHSLKRNEPFQSRTFDASSGNNKAKGTTGGNDTRFAAIEPPSEPSSSSAPSSIQELLQQGHNPGKYAQMLREILRKMSKDDSHVRLKSLEQVLQLGQNIVQQDNEEKKKKQLIASPGSPVSLPTSPIMANMSPENQKPSRNQQFASSSRNALSHSRIEADRSSGGPAASFTQSANHPVDGGGNKVVRRTSRAPGMAPENVEKKVKKAFGHPVNG